MPLQCRRLFTLIWKENFAICNCEKRRLLFAALPHIELAQIYFVLFICFYLRVKEETLVAKTDSYPVTVYMCIGGERLDTSLRQKISLNMTVLARVANQNTGVNSRLVE